MDDMRKRWLWLSSVEGLGLKRFYKLLADFEDPRAVWDGLGPAMRSALGDQVYRKLVAARSEGYIDDLIARLDRLRIEVVTRVDDDYPPLLAQIYDPPPTLFVRGRRDLTYDKSLAIVGSRRSTRDGQRAAREYAQLLSENGVCVVSGAARGIDTYSHAGALAALGEARTRGGAGSGAVNGAGGSGPVNGAGGFGAVSGAGGSGAVNGQGGSGVVNGVGGSGAVNGAGGSGAVNGVGSSSAVNGVGSSGAANGVGGSGMAKGPGGPSGLNGALRPCGLSGPAPTIAVLGCGVDIVYPPENDKLLANILATGGSIISEYMPGTPPLAAHFPARNRIISGMSQGVLLVEGAKGSGAMITVDFALEQGRDVFVVPGSVYSPQSSAPNALLRDGAIPALDGYDILSHYGWARRPGIAPPERGNVQLDMNESRVVAMLSEGETGFDELLSAMAVPPHELNSLLTMLELRGIIGKAAGRLYHLA